jgi:hypothetical protein
MRIDDDAPACWACFLAYPDKVNVLAILTLDAGTHTARDGRSENSSR